jgi:septum site-determining protein MinC
VTVAARPRPSIRFRGRSFLALVLAPEAPLADWLADLDSWMQRSPGFFVGRPVVLDLAALPLSRPDLATLIADLAGRNIRIMAVEGADPSLPGLGLPPVVNKGRQASLKEVLGGRGPESRPDEPNSLLLDQPVRSGQSVAFPKGDVIVVGSVASGAEIVAGGSIHVYGTLRGRAIAGANGNGRARIFCRKFEAELLGIDGLCKAADDVDEQLRGRAVQAWLDGDDMMMTALD